jgi:hypothetical protein
VNQQNPANTLTFVSDGDATSTLTLDITSPGVGYPLVDDDALKTAIADATAGGDRTESFFDSQNQTADFWTLIAAQSINFVPSTDQQGRPLVFASDGNVQLRVQAVFTTAATTGKVGVLTITTREVKGEGVSRMLTADVVVKDNPQNATVDAAMFVAALPALYTSVETMIITLASTLADACGAESPDVVAETLAEKAIFSVTGKAVGGGAALAEYGYGFVAVTWGETLGEIAGVGALMAIPLLVEFLGHRMEHALQVINRTPRSLSWKTYLDSGRSVLQPPGDPIAAITAQPDPLKAGSTLKLAGNLHQLFLNSTQWGPIGYVLTLDPGDGHPPAQVVVHVPWVGKNVIWVGASDEGAEQLYEKHSESPSAPLQATALLAGGYQVTVSLNRTTGTQDGAYFYCSAVVVQPV